MFIPNIKESVPSETEGLMNLEIQRQYLSVKTKLVSLVIKTVDIVNIQI